MNITFSYSLDSNHGFGGELHRLNGVLWGMKDLLHCCWLVALHLHFTRNSQCKQLIT